MHQLDPTPSPGAASESAWIEFERRLYRQTDLGSLSYVLVNEALRLTSAERVSLLLERGRRWTVVAVSGQDVFDRRSNVIRALEAFVAVTAVSETNFAYDGTPRPAPPEVDAGLTQLLDVTHARQLAAAALVGPSNEGTEPHVEPQAAPLGWLVAERFQTVEPGDLFARQVEQAAAAAAPALAAAVRFHDLPLRRVGQAIAGATRGRIPSRLAAAGILLFAATAALLFIPAELKVEARGLLQPRVRRNVFAPIDGIVRTVGVRQGERIAADARLLEMDRPELAYDLTRLEGEIKTREVRLATVRAVRLKGSSGAPVDPNDLAKLTAEEVDLDRQLDGLRRQLDELRRQQGSLVVAAPIAGEVLTWDVERRLVGRPVEKGMLLLTIGDVDGPWELVLDVPDDYAGYVRGARATTGGKPLRVEFLAAGAPETVYHGGLVELAVRGQTDDQDVTTVPAVAALDADVPRSVLHPATAVRAKIHCGRRALGYVWFVDVIHAIRSRLFF